MKLTARDTKQLGNALRRARKTAKLTQQDISARTNLRIATISTLENGEANPQLETIFRVMEALELEFDLQPRQKNNTLQLEDLLL